MNQDPINTHLSAQTDEIKVPISNDDKARRWIQRRIYFLGILLITFGCAVIIRSYRLQVRNASVLRDLAEDHYQNTIRLSPMRGTIYDRHGAEMAVSVRVSSVSVNPIELRRAGRNPAEVVELLAAIIPIDRQKILSRLQSQRHFVWIKRHITPQQAERVSALHIPGLLLQQEARRFYPNRELASHLLGFANIDGVGIEGLELSLEDRLRGPDRIVPAIRDRQGRVIFSEQFFDDESDQGHGVVMTIDKTIQHIAEHELALAVQTFEAKAGSVVVMDPRNGEILAMANYPTFNPNDPSIVPAPFRRNRAVTDRFEPGSTVKPFTVAAALDVGSIQTNQLVDCENGAMQIAEYTIHDSHTHDMLTPAQILAFSSNIGTAKIAESLGRAGLYRAFRRFGFGQTTELPLPGETAGILRHYRRWYEMDAATISFGQGMSVTTIQLAAAMSALANGGELIEPTILRRFVDGHGNTIEEVRPSVRRRVVRTDTAHLVSDMLTAVTGPGGTGEDASIEGFLVAGKTGTAQKANYIGGGYAQDRWLASFVGFVPAQSPRVVIAVVIDEPIVAHSGGVVAGPVFRRVGEATLRHLGIAAPEGGQALNEHERREQLRARALRRIRRETRTLSAQQTSEQSVNTQLENQNRQDSLTVAAITPTQPQTHNTYVPNLVGTTIRASLTALMQADLVPRVQGAGIVVSQDPQAGMMVPSGTQVHLRLQMPVAQVPMPLPEVLPIRAERVEPRREGVSRSQQGRRRASSRRVRGRA